MRSDRESNNNMSNTQDDIHFDYTTGIKGKQEVFLCGFSQLPN